MKFALLILAVLPLVFTAHVPEKKFLESLLGGYDGKLLRKELQVAVIQHKVQVLYIFTGNFIW